MRIGYARTSTLDQVAGFEAQERALAAAGAGRIYREQVSSVAARPELENMLANIRPEDTLVVTKLDRLARSVRHLGEIVEHLDKVGAGLHILDMNIDSTTASGRLMLNVFGAVAQFEREMMLERQLEGIDKAKREGKYKGRKPKGLPLQDQILAMKADGKGDTEIGRLLGIDRATVFRARKAAEANDSNATNQHAKQLQEQATTDA
nr:recombinase family protein [uncultured Pseudomonas sp.]